MPEFITAYLSLSGPAVLAGLAAGAGSYLLFGGREKPTLKMAAGTGVIAGMVSAMLQVAFGPTEGGYMPVVAALAAGATAGFIMRPKRAG
jgi:hypothetical protein